MSGPRSLSWHATRGTGLVVVVAVTTGEVERGAGVEANLGKTRVFNAAGGDAPLGVDVLGPDVWCGNLPAEQRGFVALGVPMGHPDFVKAQAASRLHAEADLLRKLMQLLDVQCAWLLLAFCAAPRAQHLLRNVPPADILPYARGHDGAVWAVVEGLLGDQGPGEGDDWAAARQVAFLPAEPGRPRSFGSGAGITRSILGGVGRCAPGTIPRRSSPASAKAGGGTGSALPTCSCGGCAPARGGGLDEQTGVCCARGADAPAAEGELGLGIPGWQRHAVLALHTSFRERVLLPALAPAARALLHSQSGRHAGMWLAAIPSDASVHPCTRPDAAMRRRLRLLGLRSMHTGTTTSPAHARACCPGVVSSLKGRGFRLLEAVGLEGRVVPQQWLSRTTAPQVHPDDHRRLDFVVYGASSRGETLCCDATLVSPLILALAAPSPVPTRGRESRLSRRADAKSRATRG